MIFTVLGVFFYSLVYDIADRHSEEMLSAVLIDFLDNSFDYFSCLNSGKEVKLSFMFPIF